MIHWCLRIGVILQCVGIAGRFAISKNETESDVYGWLFFDLNWSETVAQLVDDVGAYGCLVSAVVLFLSGFLAVVPRAPNWLRSLSFLLDIGALVFVFAWSIAMAATHSVRGDLYAELTLGEHATRIGLPIAMMLFVLYATRPSNRLVDFATWILIFASATTFAVHGFKAINAFGPFVDLILLTDMAWTEFGLEQATAESWLWVIGWIDITVAAVLVFTRWKWAGLYMAIWALITALSRITALGANAWPECLIRSANWIGPWVVVLILCHQQPGNHPIPKQAQKL